MARRGQQATHCKQGHEFTPENTYTVRRQRGPYQRCKACSADSQNKRQAYNIRYQRDYQRRAAGIVVTDQEISAMLVSQDGLCAICYERSAVVVDHDHATGRIRGMLCRGCNLALGLLGDDEESLRSALEYIATPRLKEVV